MAGIVIDIASGKVIEKINAPKVQFDRARKKPVVEILSPDGRRVLAIERHGREKRQGQSRSLAA